MKEDREPRKFKVHAPRVERNGHGVKVSGRLEVDGHALPFKYLAHEAKRHEEFLRELEDKGRRWIKSYKEHHKAIGHKDDDIEITYAQVAYRGPYDWRLVVKWKEKGVPYRMERHYRDPAEVMPRPQVLAFIKGEAQRRSALDRSKEHKEALRAVFG